MTTSPRSVSLCGWTVDLNVYFVSSMAGSMRSALVSFIACSGALLLLACDGGSEHQASAKISADTGGNVSLAGARLIVPPSALLADTQVSIRIVPADDTHGGTPQGLAPVGDRYEIDLQGQSLVIPARLELPYDPSRLPDGYSEEALFVTYFDPETKTWVPAGGDIDPVQKIVATDTTHASWWTLYTQTDAKAPLDAADRRTVFLSSNAGDPLELCPYITSVDRNPCVGYDYTQEDQKLDPINLVFYDVSLPDIANALSAEWTTPTICFLPPTHSAYAGVPGVVPFQKFDAIAQGYTNLGGCDNPVAGQNHIRIFPVSGTKWILAGVHYEQGLFHEPSGPWEGAEQVASTAFTQNFRVEPDRLLLQRNCSSGCIFRRQYLSGWATLITPKGSSVHQPLLVLNPDHGVPGANVLVAGVGFPSNARVSVYGDVGRSNLLLNSLSTDGNGNFLYAGIVPFNALTGIYAVRAQTSDRVFAEKLFTVEAQLVSPPGPPSSPPIVSPPRPVSPPLVSPPLAPTRVPFVSPPVLPTQPPFVSPPPVPTAPPFVSPPLVPTATPFVSPPILPTPTPYRSPP